MYWFLVMGQSAHDQTSAFRVGLKEIIVPSSIKKQALVELYFNQDFENCLNIV